MRKWGCKHCGWRGDDPLIAAHPFDPDNDKLLCACPKCRSICSLFIFCEVEGCTRVATDGNPTAGARFAPRCREHSD